MREDKIIESYAGVTPQRKKSKNPAKLDFWQSATGLFLALFMILHMFFVASILISREAMYAVAKFFEGSFLIEGGNPLIVSIVAVVIIIALVAHAFLAVRKFPINYRQFLALKVHKNLMKNGSAYRFWSEHFWILYIVLLFAVELHASIGLYRLCIKWGWLEGLGLKALRTIKWLMSAFFIILGLATFAAYMSYGISQTNPDINYKHYDAIEFGGR